MPPTFKDGSASPTSSESPERVQENSGVREGSGNAQPVALEVPVTVNGARAVEGSEKREPFSETTNTVLVLAKGAVIRLSASVAAGQLLFLTNEKTKKEVVCQVVKSKNYRSLSGYVELEFTEPVLGFWGMRFPGERSTAMPAASTTAAERKSESVATSDVDVIGKSTEAKPTAYADEKPAAASVTSNLADAVEEFKADIKADSRPTSRADFLAPAETFGEAPKVESSRLQEQLSALLLAEQKESEAKPAVSAALPAKQESDNAAPRIPDVAKEEPPATKAEAPKSETNTSSQISPKSANLAPKSSFESEEVAIPAWLEPLARNATVYATPAEESVSGSEKPVEEPALPAREPVSTPKQSGTGAKSVSSTPRHTPAAPVFGNTLLGGSTPEVMRPSGGNKGLWIGIAAGLIVAVASGAWYFRDSLAPLANTSSSFTTASAPRGPESVDSSSTALPPVATEESGLVATKPNAASPSPESPAPPSTLTQGKMQAAAITERISKPSSTGDGTAAPGSSIEIVEPELKRPSLGKVRLAKPKVGHGANVQANGEAEPVLELNHETLSAENSVSTGLLENSAQPAAPAAPARVGGDVTPARMLSSVPPIYPALAKTQRVAGDVRIDALIDATGRVTTMKVVSGPSLLQQAAMNALRQWKYQAATLDGKPVPMHLTVTIQFRLQ
jgi:periplasmic protein TonB